MSTGSFKYYEDFLKKKEGRNKWIEYWAVIRGTWILFYTQSTTLDRDNFRGSLELTPGTKCSVGKRRAYSFPFYISSARGAHLFKCSNNLKRHQWMYVIALAIRGDPPAPPPSYISTNEPEVTAQEHDVFQSEVPDRESKEDSEQMSDDNDSLPPGVVFVMSLPDEMADHDQDEQNKIKDSPSPSFMPGITLTTSISGYTNITRERSITDEGIALDNHNRSKQLLARSEARKLTSRSAELLRVSSPPSGGRNIAESTLSSLLTATRGSLFLSNRPNTSPGSQREAVTESWPQSHNSGNLLFSRHMVHSSPNVKMLAADDFT